MRMVRHDPALAVVQSIVVCRTLGPSHVPGSKSILRKRDGIRLMAYALCFS